MAARRAPAQQAALTGRSDRELPPPSPSAACVRHLQERFSSESQSSVDAAIEGAIGFYRNAGATITDFELPLLAYGLRAIFALELFTSTAYHSRNVRFEAVAGFSEDMRPLVEMGRLITGANHRKAEQFRRVLRDDLATSKLPPRFQERYSAGY
jgi:Asp-tRNA(Asn)/Glu-tRNA(Gln) amidotransferase A subunit family amidase